MTSGLKHLIYFILEADICFPSIAIFILGITTVHIVTTVAYRLWLSPLANIPGPKVAAATGWYEVFFQILKKPGGQFAFKITQLHEQYGPIVRISPHEVHIQDPDYFETIYAYSGTIDKPREVEHQFLIPGSVFSAPKSEHHRLRRAPLQGFFSMSKVVRQVATIQERMRRTIDRIEESHATTQEAFNAPDLVSCFAADVIIRYAFGIESDLLGLPDFANPHYAASLRLRNTVHVCIQFPWIPWLLYRLPDSLFALASPSIKPVLDLKAQCRERIFDLKRQMADGDKSIQEDTIFAAVLKSKIPAKELEVERIADEAFALVAAASDTTAWATSVALFHIVNSPDILARLHRELDENITDPDEFPTGEVLSNMTYLNACIEEGLRLSYGLLGRSIRIHRHQALSYQNYTIPAGTRVSSDSYTMHNDERIFPDPSMYRPERWIEDSGVSTTGRKLTRYLTAFGKGTRMCLGMQLAYLEMQYFVVVLLRKYNLELFETSRIDVEPYQDQISVTPHPSSKGIRFKVLNKRL